MIQHATDQRTDDLHAIQPRTKCGYCAGPSNGQDFCDACISFDADRQGMEGVRSDAIDDARGRWSYPGIVVQYEEGVR